MGMFEVIILLISVVVMIIGLLGIVIPNLPGVVLIWTGVFFYAALNKFESLDKNFLLFITSLVIFAILVDYAETIWGKKRLNHGMRGIVGAVLGGIVGSVSGEITMMIIGTIVGASFGLIISGRDPAFTVETADYKIILYTGSTIIKIAIGVTIIESFFVKVFV